MLINVESIVLFVSDIHAAATWYSKIFNSPVEYENADYAFIKTPSGNMGFHPVDAKNPGGIGGATVYWDVMDINDTINYLTDLGAQLYRGPITTSLGAKAAMLLDPFGCTLGLNQKPEL